MRSRQFPIDICLLIAACALVAVVCACQRTDAGRAGTVEKISIAVATIPEATLVQVAQANGFFVDERLEVTTRRYPYGKIALQEVLAGRADFATAAETPVMFAIMGGEKIAIVATIMTSTMGHAVVARKARGIGTVADLKGKKIAATTGTTSQFFLENLLLAYGVSRSEVEIVDVKAEAIPEVLSRGGVDAIAAFAPYTILAQKKLGAEAIVFKNADVYRYTFNIVAKQEFIRKNPATVERLLRALVRSEDFVRQNPAAAQKIVGDFIGLGTDLFHNIWYDQTYAVTLDQPLVLALEDESRWAVKNRLTAAATMPNYLNYIYLDGLRSVKPDAVRILR